MACLLCTAPGARADEVMDDAQRRVEIPARVDRVFAAGAPAEILIYTLAPEMLGGLNHQPSDAARALMPPEYRSLPPITTLPERDDPQYDRELLALQPDLYVDYGTIDADYVGALEDISKRTGIAGVIFDGRFDNIPAVYRKLGAALDVQARGDQVAAVATRLLEKHRGALAGSGVRTYLACSQDGLLPCVEGHSSGEAAAWLGAINVAGTTATAPRRALTIEEIRAAAPTVIVATSPTAAARLRADPQWRTIPAVAAGRVYAPPALPFNWGPRPPSVNRLLGMLWLAYVLPGRPFDDEFFDDAQQFFETFYHVTLTREQLTRLAAFD